MIIIALPFNFTYMKIILTLLGRLLKPGLLLYEVFRVLVLGALLILQPGDKSLIIRMIFATQGVLFPLMALFLLIDTCRYKEYIPLFIAGKIISIAVLLSFSILNRQTAAIFDFTNGMALVCLDLLSLSAILMIKRNLLILSEPDKEAE